MNNNYMILIQEYERGILVDNWYLKDTVYPGTLIFNNYEEALNHAIEETYSIDAEHRNFTAHVILCHETKSPKNNA